MQSRKVYLDNSATTQVDKNVLKEMLPYLTNVYGNPNSLHRWGRESHKAVDKARKQLANLINAETEDIIFTGSGSEAANLAIKGAAFTLRDKGKHIIISEIEHQAIINTVKWLKDFGYNYTMLPVDKFGLINPKELENAIRADTIITSVMFANNEIGTIEPIAELGSICRRHNILFHSDAVQAAGHVKIDVKELPVDLLSMAAHKMYGPKGVGALYARKGIKLTPIVHGGGQEFGLRAGTENTAAIVGFGAAAKLAESRLADGEIENVQKLRDTLISGLMERIPEIQLTGHREQRLPFHVSICVKYVEGEGMLLLLDAEGIAVSSGSACSSGDLKASHVLLACGIDQTTAHGSVRLTLGHTTTEEDINYVLDKFPPIVEKLRTMSPFYNDKSKNIS